MAGNNDYPDSVFFDSHAHFSEDQSARAAVIQRASQAGVDRILAIGGAPDLNRTALAAAREANWIRAAVGMDRTTAHGAAGEVAVHVNAVKTLLGSDREHIAAIGELGLDYHYDRDCPRTAQQELFNGMLGLARESALPVVVHCREAAEDVVAALATHAALSSLSSTGRLGVLHCFTETTDVAAALVKLGYHISFSGIVTFKNAEALRAVVPTIPDDRLMIETDSPYLAPVPHRGQTNEPAYVTGVAAMVATLRGTTLEQVAELTWRNAGKLFGF